MLLSGIHYALTYLPECILDPNEEGYLKVCVKMSAFGTPLPTHILPLSMNRPLMAQFPLKKLHLLLKKES